jgi:hypothetical protein
MITSAVRNLSDLHLAYGPHNSPDDGMCLLEAVAYMAGEPHSAHPACTSPILAAFGRTINDRLDDEERQFLAPLISRLIGTRVDRKIDLVRAITLVNASVHEIVPMVLDALEWCDLASRLREIAPIVNRASVCEEREITAAIQDEARNRFYVFSDVTSAHDVVEEVNYAVKIAGNAIEAAAYAEASDAKATKVADIYAADAARAAAYVAEAAASATESVANDRRSLARRSVVLAAIAAFERAIAITGTSIAR